MKSSQRKEKSHERSTLIWLVLFIFGILITSTIISGIITHILTSFGILPESRDNPTLVIILFMAMTSVFIGTILAIFGGEYMLRPLKRLIEATKEVAAGNFDVRVEPKGSRETRRLADNFNEMAHELASIEALRNDFVSNISHEFKTPVASIRGFVRRLKKNTLTEEKRNQYFDIIILETERLSQLSSNILLLSNLESTDKVIDTEEYSLDEQLRKSILMLEPQLEQKGLDVEVELQSIQIKANEELFSHVWINLLNNAIKFSPRGSLIKVSLQLQDESASVSVADQGIGMDEEVQKHVFDKFYQGDASRATNGNGLGLSLVKRILDLCSGDIEVSSRTGDGTCFTVSIPLIYEEHT